MGTRADFYIGRGLSAEWIGSVAMDGYPEGLADPPVLHATSEGEFRDLVARVLSHRDDATRVSDGWPWPWTTSATTDYAYAFDRGGVWASSFGGPWFRPQHGDQSGPAHASGRAVFPDMSAVQRVTLGRRSGLLALSLRGAYAGLE